MINFAPMGLYLENYKKEFKVEVNNYYHNEHSFVPVHKGKIQSICLSCGPLYDFPGVLCGILPHFWWRARQEPKHFPCLPRARKLGKFISWEVNIWM